MPDNSKTDILPEARSTAPSITLEQVSFSYPGTQIFNALKICVPGYEKETCSKVMLGAVERASGRISVLELSGIIHL